ncbi:hypothetical protein [Shewanella woodyi]|uniref:hypothetical protein n=1 Tax=Shewanella woodyi TaxID=60961 RepID=UPI0012FB5B6C|nr:hypothetical protein [Shewanella woodyi]
MEELRYLASFNTKKSYCFSTVNGVPTSRNTFTSSGTISTGFNITSIIENGTNSMSVQMVALEAPDNLDLELDSSCELLISANSKKNRYNITSVIATADDKLQPTGRSTPEYSGNNHVGPVKEDFMHDSYLYEVQRTFEAKGIPQWKWTTATSFVDTKENVQKLKDKYLDIWLLLKNKDLDVIKHESQISNQEMAHTEGMSPDEWWDTLSVKEMLSSDKSIIPIRWDEYELKTYNKGRLVRFEDMDGDSPLRVEYNDRIKTYNPYFSLINGKLVVTR